MSPFLALGAITALHLQSPLLLTVTQYKVKVLVICKKRAYEHARVCNRHAHARVDEVEKLAALCEGLQGIRRRNGNERETRDQCARGRAIFISEWDNEEGMRRTISDEAEWPVHGKKIARSGTIISQLKKLKKKKKKKKKNHFTRQRQSAQIKNKMSTVSQTPASGGPLILDGKACAAAVMFDLAARLASLRASPAGSAAGPPGLAVVLVGDRVDSATYVRMKKRACADLGVSDLGVTLPGTASTADIVAAVAALNADSRVHGILVQLPLPAGVDEAAVLSAISASKDADGLHPANVGAAVLRGPGRARGAVACTPQGCMELMRRAGISVAGKHAVVLGRSNIVGVPVAHLLLQADATVTICHSKTVDLPAVVRTADILVAAIGRPNFVKGEWLKPGAVVIDVGINGVPDASKASGQRLVGDVDFDSACQPGRASAITPVPGGVGPMTICMLMTNVIDAWERTLSLA